MSAGEWVGGILAALLGGGMFVVCMLDIFGFHLPPACWLNDWQAALLGGFYVPQLTALVLVGLAVAPGALISMWARSLREKNEAGRREQVARKLGRKPFEREGQP